MRQNKTLLSLVTKTASSALLIISLCTSLLPSSVSAAPGANTVYLVPSSSSVQSGNEFTVDLRFNPPAAGTDGVDATFTYNSDDIQYVTTDPTGSAFPSELLKSNSAGSFRIARALNIGDGFVTTDARVIQVRFKALKGGVSTALTLTKPNSLTTNATRGSDYTNPAVQGASIALSTPPVTTPPPAKCPAGKVGTPPNCTTPPASGGGSSGGTGGSSGSSNGSGSSSGPATPSSPSGGGSASSPAPSSGNAAPSSGGSAGTESSGGPVNTGNAVIADRNVEFTNAKFTITTPKATQVYIQYGLASDALSNSTEPDAVGTEHAVALDPKLLIPGETYYYTVVTKDQTGAVVSSEVQSFTTKGLIVSVVVLDKNHQPIKRQKVTLHSKPSTAMTDDKGTAVFSNVIPGDHHLSYIDGKKEYKQSLSVTNNVTVKDGVQTAPIQNVSVVYALAQSKTSPVPVVLGLFVLVVAAAAVVFTKRNQLFATASPTAPVTPDTTSHGGATAAARISNTPFISTPIRPIAETKPIQVIRPGQHPRPGTLFRPGEEARSVPESKHNGN